MSNQFYRYLSNRLEEFFKNNKIKPGERFYFDMDDKNQVEDFYRCLKDHGGRFGDGLQCKAGKKRRLNPYKKAGRSHTKGTKKTKIYEQPVKYLLKKEIAEQKVSCYNNF